MFIPTRRQFAPAHAGGRGAFPRGGFSLIELIIVLSIISVMAGMLAPVFAGSISSVQFRNARNDFIALVQFVQEAAIRGGREYRVCLDTKENAYWVEVLSAKNADGKYYEPLKDVFAQKHLLPDFISIGPVKARKSRTSKIVYFNCYPNGASDEAEVTFADRRNRGRKARIDISGTLGAVSVGRERQ